MANEQAKLMVEQAMVQGDTVPTTKKSEPSAQEKAANEKKLDEDNMQKRMKFGEHIEAEAEDSEQSLGKLGDSERNLINKIASDDGDEPVTKPSANVHSAPKV